MLQSTTASQLKKKPLPTKHVPKYQTIKPRWSNRTVIVAAPGPSLNISVAETCRNSGFPSIAVCSAFLLFPFADILYACDAAWWQAYQPYFKGEKWSNQTNTLAEQYNINIVRGHHGEGFSFNPEIIHFGSNSGFQAINLAILFGATRIILVGFNMQTMDGDRHFHGDYPKPLANEGNYRNFVPEFNKAAKLLPDRIKIINATPNSALDCFPKMDLDDAISHLQ